MLENQYTALEKAGILIESLPYIQKFRGKTMVIKYGGNAMVNEELKHAVISDILLMQLVGMRTVLVHGGGPDINSMLDKLGIESKFINGLRVTDKDTMSVVEMVLAGKVCSSITNHINLTGGKAVGLCGKDANLLTATKAYTYAETADGEKQRIDLGQVGEMKDVNTDLINLLLDQGYIPVISPVAVGPDGESYNINADLAAAAVAEKLGAEKLMLLTDVEGIFYDYTDKSSIITSLTDIEAAELIEQGIIKGGMIPKLKCCIEAVNNGVTSTHILDGRVPHSILLEVFTKSGIGTMVKKSVE